MKDFCYGIFFWGVMENVRIIDIMLFAYHFEANKNQILIPKKKNRENKATHYFAPNQLKS